MRGKSKVHSRKKSSKVTAKSHRKPKRRTKEDWQKLFRERFFV